MFCVTEANHSFYGQPFPLLETDVVRNKWVSVETPIFTQDKDFLGTKIPQNI